MSVEKQLESSAESAIVLDGVPHFVQEGMEDMQEGILPEVSPASVRRAMTELLVGLLQSVISRPTERSCVTEGENRLIKLTGYTGCSRTQSEPPLF